ncbi:hypothetical protein Q8A67_004465 [Cirrhinus molitorella]|uniref:Uncharacterized protein n=1 Tax=Cirrhinus molitorella TaxID=172907 RepID=A0AA88TWG7_9TELE|nr:hypothetical protein Q8A67_004465 [Cirrhinus molitorella]
MAVSLQNLSTPEDLLQKLREAEINGTDNEAQKFKENEVDVEATEGGLTENISYLFGGSFSSQNLTNLSRFPGIFKPGLITKNLVKNPPRTDRIIRALHEAMIEHTITLCTSPLNMNLKWSVRKEKFGHKAVRRLKETASACHRPVSRECAVIGEDALY